MPLLSPQHRQALRCYDVYDACALATAPVPARRRHSSQATYTLSYLSSALRTLGPAGARPRSSSIGAPAAVTPAYFTNLKV
jgi:hypothetical protein